MADPDEALAVSRRGADSVVTVAYCQDTPGNTYEPMNKNQSVNKTLSYRH